MCSGEFCRIHVLVYCGYLYGSRLAVLRFLSIKHVVGPSFKETLESADHVKRMHLLVDELTTVVYACRPLLIKLALSTVNPVD